MQDPHDSRKSVKPVASHGLTDHADEPGNNPEDSSRRSFIGKLGGASAALALLAGIPLEPVLEGEHGAADASVVPYGSGARANDSFNYRSSTAQNDRIDLGILPDNGDSRFSDFSGNWSKCLIHDDLGIPNRASYRTLLSALQNGRFFEQILVGNPNPANNNKNRTLGGPQGSLAFDLEGFDSHATNIPPAPSVASAQTAAEQVEHYWAALLRDVNFTDYPSNQLVTMACADLNNLSYIRSSQNREFPYPVTPANLFRGQIVPGDGPVQGPYISQFLLQPTFLGALPVTQQYQRFLSINQGGSDFLTNPIEFQNVESGSPPSFSLQFDPSLLYLRTGRDLAAYTHANMFYQPYLIALLVLAEIGAPLNPGNPYSGSRTQQAVATFGLQDQTTTMAEMTTRALKAAAFHQWIVNLRNRPEEYGGLLQANLTHQHPMPMAAQDLPSDVLNSAALPIIFSNYGSYLLPQAYPEGAPTTPDYPTADGAVGGACISALKFFFDGSQKIRPLLQAAGLEVVVPSEDGTTLVSYTGSDRDSLTVNGELAKLGWNITQGHGIHAGIHFRSSSYWSLLLGETTGLSILRDRARSYNESFRINITRFDGTTTTISN